MNEIKLSVIIPAYNAEKTIGRCLDSVLQAAKDAYIEIICIDDGSNDATWNVLRWYDSQFSCIHCFHKENGGVGSARNAGLAKATGNYITWIDADDYVTTDWYAVIHEKLQQYQPDCLFFDYFYTQGDIDTPCHIALPEQVTLKDYVYEQSLERELKNFLWNHVIKAEILKTAHFNETYHMLEDYDVLTQITPTFKTIVHSDKCLYHYVQLESSLTHNISADIVWSNIFITKERQEKYTSLGLLVSMYDYTIHLSNFLYNHGGEDNLKDSEERLAFVKHQLRLVGKNVFFDKGISKRLRIKVVFAVLGLEGILRRILKLRKRGK